MPLSKPNCAVDAAADKPERRKHTGSKTAFSARRAVWQRRAAVVGAVRRRSSRRMAGEGAMPAMDGVFVLKSRHTTKPAATSARLGRAAVMATLLRHKEGGPVSLVLVQCRKGAKPGLVWEEASLHQPDGTPTETYKAIYHI